MKGITGTSMCGTVEHVSTKRVKCDCWRCGHCRDMGKKTRGKYFYCVYYDIFEPRTTCARYTGPVRKFKTKKGKKKRHE